MSEEKWRSTKEDWPDWMDAGPAELRYADGRVVRGYLTLIEIETDDIDAQMTPVPEFTIGDGWEEAAFCDAAEWRIIPEESAT